MSRYRGYAKAPGARTYLSSRDEFTMSEDEKNEAYLRRRKAAEAAAAAPKEPRVASTSLYAQMWPSPMAIMRFEAHGTPIPPPPEGYAGPIPEKYAAFANPVPCAALEAEEEEEEEEAAESPSP